MTGSQRRGVLWSDTPFMILKGIQGGGWRMKGSRKDWDFGD